MQIKFLTIYGLSGIGGEHIEAQYNLLSYWRQSLINCRLYPIKQANIEFNDYSFTDYYDQEKLITEINYNTGCRLGDEQFWQAMGKHYNVFKDLYDDLAKTHRLMELTITTEDY